MIKVQIILANEDTVRYDSLEVLMNIAMDELNVRQDEIILRMIYDEDGNAVFTFEKDK